MPGGVATRWRVMLLVAVLAVVFAGGAVLLSDGSDGRDATTVDSCTTITEAGRYVLAADVTDSDAGTCIRVRASDVVLDGAGHRVDGVEAFGTAGVVVHEADGRLSNVTVRNVTVTDWDDGIRFIGVDAGTVAGTTTANNRVGLTLLDASGNRLADNVARGNRLRGISLLETSANNTLVNNTAVGNALFGIHLVEAGVRNNTLVGNNAANNEFGVVLVGVHDNVVTDTTATGNRIAGVWLSAATGNRVTDSVVSNRFYGVFLADLSSENVVSNNTADGNAVGVRLRSSDDNVVAGNVVRNSTDIAILLISSDRNAVTDNTGTDNRRGVVALRSTENTVANNTLAGG